MPLISVIIPAYNAAPYLGECLESVIAQTFCDIEIIVVDDGSTDATAEIARNFAAADSRIRLLSKPNGGLSDARNFGIACARGEYITFVDSDDCLFPDSLAILLKGMESGNSVAISAGGFTRNRLPDRKPGRGMAWKVYDAQEAVLRVLYQRGLDNGAWAKLYNRRIFDKNLFRVGITYEDLDMVCGNFFAAGKIAVTDGVVYYYRPNGESITGRFSPKRFDVLEVTRRIEEYMAANHPALLPAARDRRLSANFNMLGLIAANCPDGTHSDVADECWRLIRNYRRESLLNPRVRLKNKAGIILSYLGRPVFEFFAKRIYR